MSCDKCTPTSNYEDMCAEGQSLYLDARRRWATFMKTSLYTDPDPYLWKAYWQARLRFFEHLGAEDSLSREAAKNKRPATLNAETARLPYADGQGD